MRSCKPIYLALALAAFASAPAIAQQSGPSTYPAACDASKVSKSDVDRAHTVFLSGKQYLEESNYDKAISYFKDAYSIDCSIHAILPIIASAYERKGDKGEAVHALEEYQKRAPTAPDHEVMDRRIRNLKDQLAREQPAPTATATAAPSATAAAPTASANSVPTAAPTTTSSPPQPPPDAAGDEGGAHSLGPWLLVGGGALVAVAGVVLFAVGSGDVSSAEAACGGGHSCPLGDTVDASKGNDGRTFETVGVVMMPVGAAVAALGLILHFSAPAPRKASAGNLHLAPVYRPSASGRGDFTGVSVSGAF